MGPNTTPKQTNVYRKQCILPLPLRFTSHPFDASATLALRNRVPL